MAGVTTKLELDDFDLIAPQFRVGVVGYDPFERKI